MGKQRSTVAANIINRHLRSGAGIAIVNGEFQVHRVPNISGEQKKDNPGLLVVITPSVKRQLDLSDRDIETLMD
ncbi:hypothetical protein KC842_00845 [Candidatus Nomurabacteria bacterium]|nr:hypothetical protein [Candidatus Nomurabacteria bacterium]USN95028.1 MAG: hypothetical protein H6791_01190 [Candidatus Nomurabacteria bacterium]